MLIRTHVKWKLIQIDFHMKKNFCCPCITHTIDSAVCCTIHAIYWCICNNDTHELNFIQTDFHLKIERLLLLNHLHDRLILLLHCTHDWFGCFCIIHAIYWSTCNKDTCLIQMAFHVNIERLLPLDNPWDLLMMMILHRPCDWFGCFCTVHAIYLTHLLCNRLYDRLKLLLLYYLHYLLILLLLLWQNW